MNKLLLAVLFLAISVCAYINPQDEKFQTKFNGIRKAYAKENKISDIKDLSYDRDLGLKALDACVSCKPKEQVKVKPGVVIYASMNAHDENEEGLKKVLGDPAMKHFGYCTYGSCQHHHKFLLLSPGASSFSVNSLIITMSIVLILVA